MVDLTLHVSEASAYLGQIKQLEDALVSTEAQVSHLEKSVQQHQKEHWQMVVLRDDLQVLSSHPGAANALFCLPTGSVGTLQHCDWLHSVW